MHLKTPNPVLLLMLLAGVLLTACSDDQASASADRAAAVTVTWPELKPIERIETVVGRLAAASSPIVAAETAGRIERIHKDAGDRVEAGELLAELDARSQQMAVDSATAEVRRLSAMLENQQVQVTRLRNLAQRQSVAQDQLDQAETQIRVYSAQLEAAEARLAEAELNLDRAGIVSPVSGYIQARRVSEGDFVALGQGLFEVVAPEALRAILPLPESLQQRVSIGQPVRMAIPSSPGQWIETRVNEIRPVVGRSSRAIELIVDLENPGQWRSGGSVTAELILDRHESLIVPPNAVVRRPAGIVVYVFDGDRHVQEQRVELGIRHPQWVEIAAGLDKAQPVVVDGAGFLTHGARVDVQRWLDPLEEPAP